MLYDILIIDDDFSGESVLDDLALSPATQGNSISWDNTIMPLYFDLTRKNLKVIWSTGEMDDLEKLEDYQLSTVKYIICDLQLTGINNNTDEKNIIGKIVGILEKLNIKFNEKDISFLINSKYIDDHPNIKHALQTILNEKYPNKYTVKKFRKKNAITAKQEKELLATSLLSHIKEQVIKKHLEVEACLDEKIGSKNTDLRELSFSAKYKIVKHFFHLDKDHIKIKELNETRNYIAHNKINSLADLENSKDKKSKDLKKLKYFSDLIDYLKKADDLITLIKNSSKNK